VERDYEAIKLLLSISLAATVSGVLALATACRLDSPYSVLRNGEVLGRSHHS
jgi:hypothetical protein